MDCTLLLLDEANIQNVGSSWSHQRWQEECATGLYVLYHTTSNATEASYWWQNWVVLPSCCWSRCNMYGRGDMKDIELGRHHSTTIW